MYVFRLVYECGCIYRERIESRVGCKRVDFRFGGGSSVVFVCRLCS